MADIIDTIMGFNPSEVVNAFNQSEKGSYVNPNVYKTNPKNSKTEDGHYHSRIRVLYNPYDLKRSIVHQAAYSMSDANGFFQVKSALSNGDKNCPIFKAWKQLWFATGTDTDKNGKKCDLAKREFCKEVFDKSETDWVLIQVIEDENQPELVGQFKLFKMPKSIMNRLMAKMNPTDGKKTPQPLMDYLFGPVLEMDVTPGPDDPEHPERKQREISYDLCDFDTDPYPFIQRDGKQFFTDEEIEMIETYNAANNDLLKAKTDAKRVAAQETKDGLKENLRELYKKSLDYLKANAIDVVAECAYQPWDAETTTRVNAWIEEVVNMRNPKAGAPVAVTGPTEEAHGGSTETFTAPAGITAAEDNDLPF